MIYLNTRRGFLQALACTPVLPSMLVKADAKAQEVCIKESEIGVQIYSVREALKIDAKSTFSRLAKIGFSNIECFDITQLEQQSGYAKELGLNINSIHVLSPYLSGNQQLAKQYNLAIPNDLNSIDKVIAKLKTYNINQLVLSYLFGEERQNIEQYYRLAEVLQVAGEKCHAAGIQLCYHNHDFEFYQLDQETPFEVLVKQTSSEALKFELDVFWTKFAGLVPESIITALGHRCRALHLKDLKLEKAALSHSASPENVANIENFVPLGQGNINFSKILLTAKKSGVQQLYIEQDHSKNNIFKDLQTSFSYLQKLRCNQGK